MRFHEMRTLPAIWAGLAVALAVTSQGTRAPGAALARGSRLLYLAGTSPDTMVWPIDSVIHASTLQGKTGVVRVFFAARPGLPTATERSVWFDGRLLHEWDARGSRWVAQRPIVPNDSLSIPRPNAETVLYETGPVSEERLSGVALDVVATTVTTRGADGRVRRRLVEGYAPALLTAVRGEFARPDPATPGSWIVDQRFHLAGIVR
jgi:hypothetical protein